MKFKRILTATLASAMLFSMSTGCKRKVADIDYDEIMSRENVENYVYPGDGIELKIPVYNRGQAGLPDVTENYWTDYVQKNFGDKHNIKVKFISVPRSSEITVFNQLMIGSEKNMPDILYNYDYPNIVNFANNGYFQELDEEMIEKYAPTYYKNTKDLEEYTYLGGKRYFLAATRPKAYNYVSLIRKDWIDKTGRDSDVWYPTSTEEYLDLLRDFKKLKLGGENTIPENKSMGNANYGNYYYREHPYPAVEHALYSDITVASLTYEPTMLSLKDDNKKYNEGLVSSEWYLDQDGSKAKEAFVSGRAGTYGLYLSKNDDVIKTLKDNVPGAEVMVLPGYADARYNHGTPGRMDNPFGLMTGINALCDHPEAVLMYFEWLSQPENLFVMQNGVEGKTYNMEDAKDADGNLILDENGEPKQVPVLVSDYAGDERLNYNANKDMWCLVIEGRDLGDEYMNVVAQAMSNAPTGYEYLIFDAYESDKEGGRYNYTVYMFTQSIESLSENSGKLLAKWQEAQTVLTNCKPEEFDDLYKRYCKEYLALGYQDVLDEKLALFKEEQKIKAEMKNSNSKLGDCTHTEDCDVDLVQDIKSKYIPDYEPISK